MSIICHPRHPSCVVEAGRFFVFQDVSLGVDVSTVVPMNVVSLRCADVGDESIKTG